MILKNSSKLIEKDENLMKTKLFVTKIILVTMGASMSIRIIFEKPMRCFGCWIDYFDLKYLSQNSINFNMLGVFWNPQDEQISKLSLDLYSEQHLNEILRFFTAARAVCHHSISLEIFDINWPVGIKRVSVGCDPFIRNCWTNFSSSFVLSSTLQAISL